MKFSLKLQDVNKRQRIIFICAGLLCLTPFISSPMALVLGFTLASLGWVPVQWNIAALTKKLLSYSIIGLGFGINVTTAIEASTHNFGLIVGSIFSLSALVLYSLAPSNLIT